MRTVRKNCTLWSNKNQAMKYGLTVAQVYQQISAKLTKESAATTLSENGSSMDVVVENSTSKAFTREDLENMKLRSFRKCRIFG